MFENHKNSRGPLCTPKDHTWRRKVHLNDLKKLIGMFKDPNNSSGPLCTSKYRLEVIDITPPPKKKGASIFLWFLYTVLMCQLLEMDMFKDPHNGGEPVQLGSTGCQR